MINTRENKELIKEKLIEACPQNYNAAVDILLDTFLTVGKVSDLDAMLAFLKLRLTVTPLEENAE